MSEVELFGGTIPVCVVRTGEKNDGKSHDGAVLEVLGTILGTDPGPGWEIRTEERGKPYFENHREVAFSVSDCAGYTAVCFDQTRVGLDLQEHRRRASDTREKLLERCLKLARRAFHERENDFVRDGLRAGDEEAIRRFFRIWSAKEAYVKYTGSGIDDQFAHIPVIPEDPILFKPGEEAAGPGSAFTETGSAEWSALGKWFYCADLFFAGEDLTCSLCVCGEERKPVVYRPEPESALCRFE